MASKTRQIRKNIAKKQKQPDRFFRKGYRDFIERKVASGQMTAAQWYSRFNTN